MYFGPTITNDSWAGGNSVLEGLVITYLSFRIAVCVFISVLAATQLYFEIKYQTKRTMLNARLLTFVGVILYPLFRVFYTAFYWKERNEDVGTVCDFTSLFSIFFQMWSWTWVGAYWCRLLLALFSVNISYNQKVFKLSWSIIGVFFTFIVMYIVFSLAVPSIASMFFTGGFLVLLVGFGSVCVGFGFFLYRQIYHHKGDLLTDRVKAIIKRIRNLAIVMTCSIIVTVVRDLFYYVVFKVPLDSSLKHASNVITMTVEFVLAACIIISVSEEPMNYLKFKCVNPSLVPRFPTDETKDHSFNSATSSLSQKSTSLSIGSSRTTSSSVSSSSSSGPILQSPKARSSTHAHKHKSIQLSTLNISSSIQHQSNNNNTINNNTINNNNVNHTADQGTSIITIQNDDSTSISNLDDRLESSDNQNSNNNDETV
ncbi:hypothetical protein DFA_10159 [Cavenderia fasciculata]|uniref:THH1/TOM1/TOM3 domain-containing protein n=1 Tax=Cavenderia fasciculata TaxID=261658 RepID=F4Q9F6_CACFS|nr:uncharacterized protein DFA_10159 [Cavenderia fasciculata]EGG15325.1 hypothetical protein DFA_10159 [Cavenderia fasciculata]|eukprot:XP_004352045.1 hypothetical protein DFA_10159 [Cavenderia fasciculata]